MKAHRHTAGNSGPDCTRRPGWPHPPLVGGVETVAGQKASKGIPTVPVFVSGRARPTRYPDSEFITAPPPSQTHCPVACLAAWRFVTRYSGATVPDSHGVPAAPIVIQTSGDEERLASSRSKNSLHLCHAPSKAKGKLCVKNHPGDRICSNGSLEKAFWVTPSPAKAWVGAGRFSFATPHPDPTDKCRRHGNHRHSNYG